MREARTFGALPDEDVSDMIDDQSGEPTSERRVDGRFSAVAGLDIKANFRRAPKIRGSFLFWFALIWIGLLIFVAIFASLLPLKPFDVFVKGMASRSVPGPRGEFLGTDTIGRSVLSRLVFGARESMLVGLLSTAAAMGAGLVIGITAGFLRGKVDAAIGVVVDAVLSIPSLVLLLALAAVGKRDLTTLVAGLGIVGAPIFARLARAATLSLTERDYVTAARVMGATSLRIMCRELLPEVVLRASSFAFVFLAWVIVAEGSLSFLGLGIPPPHPSWGGMINDGRPFLESDPYLVFVPAICMFFTVASFTVLGDHARRRFDTRGAALI